MISIVECPRDAMQGLVPFIPTNEKANYINQLLKVGFDTLDFGSFVSPKAIPQMRDTAEVLARLELEGSGTQLLSIVANTRGALEAVKHQQISYIGFPFSISETFQKINTNKSIKEALKELDEILTICNNANRQLVAYISMGFGNPYNDPYSPDEVSRYTDILINKGIRIISLSDTVGLADTTQIADIFSTLIPIYPDVTFGAHLHARPEDASDRIKAAYKAGCRRFDGAIRGFGGCPMANDELVGNIATETLISCLEEYEDLKIDKKQFSKAEDISINVFG